LSLTIEQYRRIMFVCKSQMDDVLAVVRKLDNAYTVANSAVNVLSNGEIAPTLDNIMKSKSTSAVFEIKEAINELDKVKREINSLLEVLK
jgi:hypothetical protein